jgi:hypothetical protein
LSFRAHPSSLRLTSEAAGTSSLLVLQSRLSRGDELVKARSVMFRFPDLWGTILGPFNPLVRGCCSIKQARTGLRVFRYPSSWRLSWVGLRFISSYVFDGPATMICKCVRDSGPPTEANGASSRSCHYHDMNFSIQNTLEKGKESMEKHLLWT